MRYVCNHKEIHHENQNRSYYHQMGFILQTLCLPSSPFFCPLSHLRIRKIPFSVSVCSCCVSPVFHSHFSAGTEWSAHIRSTSVPILFQKRKHYSFRAKKSGFGGSAATLLFRQIPYADLTALLVFISFSEFFPLNATLIVLNLSLIHI